MFALTFLAAVAHAGQTTHEVELLGGAQHLIRNDKQISALPHTGTSPTFDLRWSPRAPRGAHVVAISFTPATTQSVEDWSFHSDGETLRSGPDGITMVDLQYAYGRKFEGNGWTVHLGGTLATHFEDVATDYGFLGLKTYLGVIGVGPWADLRVSVRDRHTFEAQAWTPVASWVSRNPYAVHDGDYIFRTRNPNVPLTIGRLLADGKPQAPNHYQAVHLRAGYAYGLFSHFDLVARARLDGLHLTRPQPLLEWQLGLDLGLRGSF